MARSTYSREGEPVVAEPALPPNGELFAAVTFTGGAGGVARIFYGPRLDSPYNLPVNTVKAVAGTAVAADAVNNVAWDAGWVTPAGVFNSVLTAPYNPGAAAGVAIGVEVATPGPAVTIPAGSRFYAFATVAAGAPLAGEMSFYFG